MIDHTPCLTDEEISVRIVSDSMTIDKLRAEGHLVRTKVSWHSETTLETHCLPIFETDDLEDILNRYYDFFPKECLKAIEETQAIRETLFQADGMSKAKTIMLSFRVPLGLWKLLEAWEPTFWDVDPTTKGWKNTKLIGQFLKSMSKLKVQTPYGRPSVVVG